MYDAPDVPENPRIAGVVRESDHREDGWLLRYLLAQPDAELTEVYPGRYWFRTRSTPASDPGE